MLSYNESYICKVIYRRYFRIVSYPHRIDGQLNRGGQTAALTVLLEENTHTHMLSRNGKHTHTHSERERERAEISCEGRHECGERPPTCAEAHAIHGTVFNIKQYYLTSQVRKMATLARSYLYEKLGPIVGASRDGIVEYLLSCDASTQQNEMVSFLEQFGGKNPKFRAIIKQYALLEKNLGRAAGSGSTGKDGGASDMRKQKNVSAKQGNKDKDNEKRVVLDTNCGCMATKHSIWGSCSACGRIYCTEEQVESCKYCGEGVSPCMSADDAAAAGLGEKCVSAYRHKVIF